MPSSFPRGAIPSPRHRLAGARPHVLSAQTPPNILYLPKTLSMWLNDVDGDCVTAEEAFAKACSIPEILISDATVGAWATSHGVLNGAELTDVLDWMESGGFVQSSEIYNSGPPVSVDWTNSEILQNAISLGPVKIGVAADQLQNVVPDPPTNGWIATGFTQDSNEDHCVSLCGFGTFGWISEKLGTILPAGINPSTPGYALFTWSSIGIIDEPSMLAITSEAWLRNPTTITRTFGL
jgi:hypothetical protein